jgi:hypothetical protein
VEQIEHRLFFYVALSGRGRALRTFETVVRLTGKHGRARGLRVQTKLVEHE